MKRSNKIDPNCQLNRRLHELYNLKQQINNSKISEPARRTMMKECDKEINLAWRNHYAHKEGYETLDYEPDEKAKLQADVISVLQRVRVKKTAEAVSLTYQPTVKARNISAALIDLGWDSKYANNISAILFDDFYFNDTYTPLCLLYDVDETRYADAYKAKIKQAAIDLLRELCMNDTVLVDVSW